MEWTQLRLTDYGPLDRLDVILEQTYEGWFLKTWHRHVGGRMADCEQECYQAENLEEAVVLIRALLTVSGHVESSAERPAWFRETDAL